MKVNVVLISYNQEQYIASAIESILMQRVNKGVEVSIIIADDCSTDNTLGIIKAYETNSSFPFVYLSSEKNVGHVRNYQRAFAVCNGEYVAILEGDDWWSSPLHIQSHLDFLDIHRECVLTSQRPVWYFESEHRFMPTWLPLYNGNDYKYITIEEEICANRIINLSSCLIRGTAIRNLNNKIYECSVLDWPMYVNLSQMGLLCILSGTSNVYRAKSSGLYAGLDKEKEIKMDEKLINEIEKIFPQYASYYLKARQLLYPKTKKKIRKTIEFFLYPFVCFRKICHQIFLVYKEM